MPIEIKELHIKAVIDSNTQESEPASTNPSGAGMPPEKIITICVEKVLEILKEKAER